MDEPRRSFLQKLAVGSGFVRPAVASFTMTGLAIADASVAVANATTRASMFAPTTAAPTRAPTTSALAPGSDPATPSPSPINSGGSPTDIPEPASALILGIGAALQGSALLTRRVRLLLERWSEEDEP